MQLFAQALPDPTPIITKASGVSWEAGMLAFIMVVFLSVIIYMIKRQNDQMEAERKSHIERENRLGLRIDSLEDKMHAMEADHSAKSLAMTREVTVAILKAAESQGDSSVTIQTLIATMNEVNGDIKDLCQLIRMSPCLLTGCGREGYQLADKDGNVVRFEETRVVRK